MTAGLPAPGGATTPGQEPLTARSAPLRLWLEPGYDHGRVGAWLLDLPGAFAWAATRDQAVQGSLSVAGRVREWLAEHGERAELPPLRGIEIVEEVATSTAPDGTERNALFAADLVPVTAADVERTVRWLAYARADLIPMIERVDAHERSTGPLPRDEDRGERTSDTVLRHLAGSEVWLLSRIDPAVRYPGDPEVGDPRIALAEVRVWSEGALQALLGRHPATERTDGKGERWTLRKVLRRLVYHALDHLWELDRRLARADGTADRVVVTLDRRPDVEDLVPLLLAVGWDPRTDHPDLLARSEAGSTVVVGAWDGDRLVGHARAVSDGAMTAYVSMVIVHPRWQGLGLGRRIMETLLAGNDGLRIALSAAPGLDGWYGSLGFEPDPRAFVRRRRVDGPATR